MAWRIPTKIPFGFWFLSEHPLHLVRCYWFIGKLKVSRYRKEVLLGENYIGMLTLPVVGKSLVSQIPYSPGRQKKEMSTSQLEALPLETLTPLSQVPLWQRALGQASWQDRWGPEIYETYHVSQKVPFSKCSFQKFLPYLEWIPSHWFFVTLANFLFLYHAFQYIRNWDLSPPSF